MIRIVTVQIISGQTVMARKFAWVDARPVEHIKNKCAGIGEVIGEAIRPFVDVCLRLNAEGLGTHAVPCLVEGPILAALKDRIGDVEAVTAIRRLILAVHVAEIRQAIDIDN